MVDLKKQLESKDAKKSMIRSSSFKKQKKSSAMH